MQLARFVSNGPALATELIGVVGAIFFLLARPKFVKEAEC
jgi:hypothetical protein